MELQVNLWMWGLAASPVIILLVLMLRFNWGAAAAAPLGAAAAIAVGILFYGANLELILVEGAKGIWSALIVLYVIFPALLLYEVVCESKAFEVIKRGLQRFTPNELLQVMTIGWVFTSFLQGITGFGVPVAVAAPLLIEIGVLPVWSVVLALVGQAWANTFGTLGIAWQALASQTGIEGTAYYGETALWSAVFLLIVNVLTGIAFCYMYGKMTAVRKGLAAVLIISLIQGGGQLILSQINPEVSCFVSTLVTLVAIFFIGKLPVYRTSWQIDDSPIMDRMKKQVQALAPARMAMGEAFMPYLVLTGLTLVFLLVPPVNRTLNAWQLGLPFPETRTQFGIVNKGYEMYKPFSPLTHAGTLLLISLSAGYVFFRVRGYISPGKVRGIWMKSVEKTVPSSIAIVALIVMSKVMGSTGQTNILAAGTTAVMGQYYAGLAPGVGVLGSFMTSSNMSSNILFGVFQLMTAKMLKIDIPLILGAHTAGGSIGSAIAPSKIILGATTAGIIGREGEILKKVMPMAIISAVLVGVIVMVMMYVKGLGPV